MSKYINISGSTSADCSSYVCMSSASIVQALSRRIEYSLGFVLCSQLPIEWNRI